MIVKISPGKSLKNVTEAQTKAKAQIEKSQQNSKERYDKNVWEEIYEIGSCGTPLFRKAT